MDNSHDTFRTKLLHILHFDETYISFTSYYIWVEYLISKKCISILSRIGYCIAPFTLKRFYFEMETAASSKCVNESEENDQLIRDCVQPQSLAVIVQNYSGEAPTRSTRFQLFICKVHARGDKFQNRFFQLAPSLIQSHIQMKPKSRCNTCLWPYESRWNTLMMGQLAFNLIVHGTSYEKQGT